MRVCQNGHRFRSPRVVYGLPTPEAVRDAEEGRIVLGGCDPTFPVEPPCPTCGLPGRELRSELRPTRTGGRGPESREGSI